MKSCSTKAIKKAIGASAVVGIVVFGVIILDSILIVRHLVRRPVTKFFILRETMRIIEFCLCCTGWRHPTQMEGPSGWLVINLQIGLFIGHKSSAFRQLPPTSSAPSSFLMLRHFRWQDTSRRIESLGILR